MVYALFDEDVLPITFDSLTGRGPLYYFAKLAIIIALQVMFICRNY